MMHTNKTQDNKSQAVANKLPKAQLEGEPISPFVDNRPEAIRQKKLQDTIVNSPKVQQLKAFREMANPVQRAMVAGKKITIVRDLKQTYPDKKDEIEALVQAPEKFDELKKMLSSAQTFESYDELIATLEAKFTSDPEKAALSDSGEGLSPLNEKKGTVSGLTKGIGGGFKAGTGDNWHVHYDHVKFGSNGGSRVDLHQNDKYTDILDEINQKAGTIPRTGQYWDACLAYLRKHYPD